jgi:hypothetical protein
MKKFLAVLLIKHERLNSLPYQLRLLGILLVLLFLSFKLGDSLLLQADFTVFWQAGRNFTSGLGLYDRLGGAERYIYPPFAAMLFQFFGIFPLKVAGMVWAFINFLIWFQLVFVTREIMRYHAIPEKQIKRALIIGFFLSFRYFWYHVLFMQMNLFVLLLCMVAYLFFLRRQIYPALIILIVATQIKILPIIFLGWMLSKTNKQVWLKTLGIAILITALPVIWRGYEIGINDISDFYNSFLEPFQKGAVEPKLQNYALSAAIYKWFLPLSKPSIYYTPLVVLSLKTVALLYKSALVLLVTAFLTVVIYSRFKKLSISIHEISFVLLLTHLVSGITWEYHLVSFLVIYAIYFSVDCSNDSRFRKAIHYFIIVLMVFNGILGLDTVGKTFYYVSCGYSLPTLLLLVLLVDSFIRILSKHSARIFPEKY